MSQKQINRYVVIQRSLVGAISVKDAAAALNLSERQVIRLRNGVREDGAEAQKMLPKSLYFKTLLEK